MIIISIVFLFNFIFPIHYYVWESKKISKILDDEFNKYMQRKNLEQNLKK